VWPIDDRVNGIAFHGPANVQLSGRATLRESATRAHNEMERSRRRRDAV
jgi:hypothetical protein